MKKFNKVVLAYSGGLDTSIIISWLKEIYGCEVIAVVGNVGQADELEGLEEKALKTGASKIYIEDLTKEFVYDYIFPTLQAGAVYEGKYLLGTSFARPLIGKRLVEIAEKEGYQVVSMDILPDDRDMLARRMAQIADENLAELILTTGGTGFSARDVMPEATEDVIERRVPGIPEAIRAYSMTITKRAMLSRATAGIRRQTLIINLPGSPKAVRESLEYIISALGHGIEILTGETGNCGG